MTTRIVFTCDLFMTVTTAAEKPTLAELERAAIAALTGGRQKWRRRQEWRLPLVGHPVAIGSGTLAQAYPRQVVHRDTQQVGLENFEVAVAPERGGYSVI